MKYQVVEVATGKVVYQTNIQSNADSERILRSRYNKGKVYATVKNEVEDSVDESR